jgi:hypothetical protein
MPRTKGKDIPDFKLDIVPKIGATSDWTDPEGTVRPDVPPQDEIGNKALFEPLNCPYFGYQDTLPEGVSKDDPFELFASFFAPSILESIVENTNRNTPLPPGWTPLTILELYTFIGVLVYIGLHYELSIKMYWSTDPFTLKHTVFSSRMSRNRFEAISSVFYLVEPGVKASKTAFEKVS